MFYKNHLESNVKLLKILDITSDISVGMNRFEDKQNESNDLEEGYLLAGHNITENGLINLSGAKTIFVEPLLAMRKQLKVGDVIFLSKGTNLRAALITNEQKDEKIYAPATCLVIRPKQDKILSEVLVTFLNSQYGQAMLKTLSKGATIQHIPASTLKDIEINIPSMSKQEKIAEVFHSHNQTMLSLEALKVQQSKTTEALFQSLMK